jgi:ElaB/YqjD/DUF883 family membrane-anchored ribosome-binding protein
LIQSLLQVNDEQRPYSARGFAMTERSLDQLELDVEAARAKLSADLATLRAPATATEFTEALKREAMEAKDSLLDKARSSVRTSIDSLIEDLKGRASANPAATLAIGAGIAWRLLRRPPIATALVGAGLLSLFRTQPVRTNGHAPADYLTHAKTRLMEQASEAAEIAKTKVSTVTQSAAEKVTETAGNIEEQVERLTAQASSAAADAVRNTTDHTSARLKETIDAVHKAGQRARFNASAAASCARTAVDEPWQLTQAALSDADDRDKLLLATAGLAVVAALGISWQRRLTEDNEVN